MARFLKSCMLLREHQKIKPFTIEFVDGLNVIVGKNGSGKSTLLHLLTTQNQSFQDLRKVDHEPNLTFRFLDTEKQNPRLKHSLEFSETIAFDIGSRFVSHGEAMLPLILASKEFKDIVLFIDEPESGISLQNQKKIFDSLQQMTCKNNCQVIITTHSYVMIKSVGRVFCMDNKKWLTSEKYLKDLKLWTK